MIKIRGQRRRLRQTERWREQNMRLPLEYLEREGREYARFTVHPWGALVTHETKRFPEPRGEMRRTLTCSLLDIYDSWYVQLTALGKPFYLRICLFESNFRWSQVVCAIGESLHFYDNAYPECENPPRFQPRNWGPNAERLSRFEWRCCLDELRRFESDYAENQFDTHNEYLAERRRLNRKLQKPHRTEMLDFGRGPVNTMYSFPIGRVWIGQKSTKI